MHVYCSGDNKVQCVHSCSCVRNLILTQGSGLLHWWSHSGILHSFTHPNISLIAGHHSRSDSEKRRQGYTNHFDLTCACTQLTRIHCCTILQYCPDPRSFASALDISTILNGFVNSLDSSSVFLLSCQHRLQITILGSLKR